MAGSTKQDKGMKACKCEGFEFALAREGFETLLTMTGAVFFGIRFKKPERKGPKTMVFNYCPWCGADLVK